MYTFNDVIIIINMISGDIQSEAIMLHESGKVQLCLKNAFSWTPELAAFWKWFNTNYTCIVQNLNNILKNKLFFIFYEYTLILGGGEG